MLIYCGNRNPSNEMVHVAVQIAHRIYFRFNGNEVVVGAMEKEIFIVGNWRKYIHFEFNMELTM